MVNVKKREEKKLIALKLSLLRKEHLLSADDVLTNSPNILNISKRDFFQFNYLTMINEYVKGAGL